MEFIKSGKVKQIYDAGEKELEFFLQTMSLFTTASYRAKFLTRERRFAGKAHSGLKN